MLSPPTPASHHQGADGLGTGRTRRPASSAKLPPSIWAQRKLRNNNIGTTDVDITPYLNPDEIQQFQQLCGKFVYSLLEKAIHAEEHGEEVFVATGREWFEWVRYFLCFGCVLFIFFFFRVSLLALKRSDEIDCITEILDNLQLHFLFEDDSFVIGS